MRWTSARVFSPVRYTGAPGGAEPGDGKRIGRDIYWNGSWHERGDTRIAPGESLKIARIWHVHATAARVTVEAHPDEYYEGLYATRLGPNPLYAAALQKARGSHYIAETREIALP